MSCIYLYTGLTTKDKTLKGVFTKNERGYRLNAIKKRFLSLVILLLSVASIRRKLIKTSHTEERSIKFFKFNILMVELRNLSLIRSFDNSFNYMVIQKQINFKKKLEKKL